MTDQQGRDDGLPLPFREVQRFRQWWLWALLLATTLAVAGIFGYGMVHQLVLGKPWGARPMSDLALAIVGTATIAFSAGLTCFFYALHLITEVRTDGIFIRFFPLPSTTIPFGRISRCYVRTYHPLREYGGWGIKYGSKGKAYNVSGTRGVQLEVREGSPVLIGSQQPEELARAITDGTAGAGSYVRDSKRGETNVVRSITAVVGILLASAGCVGIPAGVHPVRNVQVDRYLGTWYEIARLDHGFERGLSNVTATYTARPDGGIDVLNRGFDAGTGAWKEARGRAFFVGDTTVGQLKVSFFGPFYGGYNIIALDTEGYAYSMVCGPNRSYLWILARETTLPAATVDRLVRTAAGLGFATGELIFVRQDPFDS